MRSNIILSRVSILLLTLLCNWNGSMILDNNTSKDPEISFNGELFDHSGAKSRKLEHLLIGGKYEAIPFYQTVSKKEISAERQIDPKQNRVLVDLKEIASIELKHPESPTKSEIELHGRKYVEIIVTSTNQNKKHYLVESSRKLTFEEQDPASTDSLARTESQQTFSGELTFIHVKKLIVGPKGFEKNNSINKADDKKYATEETEDLLNQIEKNIQNLPKNDASLLLNIKSTLLSLLRSLRAQLQKLVDMIH